MFRPWQDPKYRHELGRKSIHITLGIIIVVLISNRLITPFFLFLVLALIVILAFLSSKYRIPGISTMLKHFDRPNHFPAKGLITYLIGCILCLELFPISFALASIMVLAFGDGTAALARPWSKHKSSISQKHLIEETIVGIVASTIAASFFVSFPQALLASAFAMIVEALEVKFNNEILDDNILTPLAAGTMLLLLSKFGLFVM